MEQNFNYNSSEDDRVDTFKERRKDFHRARDPKLASAVDGGLYGAVQMYERRRANTPRLNDSKRASTQLLLHA